MESSSKICIQNLNGLLESYKMFLIKTVSDMTGRYVSIENDDEYSIALAGFVEAVERYEEQKGAFPSFAKLVIESRIRNYWDKNKKAMYEISLDNLKETGVEIPVEQVYEEQQQKEELTEEIKDFDRELSQFGLSLEILADHAPKHKDTRRQAYRIAGKSEKDELIVNKTYANKRLPVRDVSRLCEVSEKMVKRNRFFILGSLIILVKKFLLLRQWIQTEEA